MSVELTDIALQKHTGYVHGFTDSGLVISSKAIEVGQGRTLDSGEAWFAISQINHVVIRRKGAAVHGLLIGAVAGVVLGGVTGAITYKDPGPNAFLDFGRGFDMAIGASAGALLGGLTGVLAAPLKKEILDNTGKLLQLSHILSLPAKPPFKKNHISLGCKLFIALMSQRLTPIPSTLYHQLLIHNP